VHVVRAFAHSQAIASFSARAFNEVATEINVQVRIVFVPCYLYQDTASGECVIEERYLPGVFVKYNSNNGTAKNTCSCQIHKWFPGRRNLGWEILVSKASAPSSDPIVAGRLVGPWAWRCAGHRELIRQTT